MYDVRCTMYDVLCTMHISRSGFHHSRLFTPPALAARGTRFGACAPRKSVRAISIARLYITVEHLRPINVVVYDGPR